MNTFLNTKGAAVVFLIIFAFVVFGLSAGRAYFYADAARDLFVVDMMRLEKYFPVVGHENVIGYNPPLYYYLLYVVSFVVGNTYNGVQRFFFLWTTAGILLFFRILVDHYNLRVRKALIFTVFFVTSSVLVTIATHAWSVHFVFTLGVLCFYLLLASIKTGSSTPILAALIPFFFGSMIDLSMLLYVAIFTYVLIQQKTSRGQKIYILAIYAALLLLIFGWTFFVNGRVLGSENRYLNTLLSGYFQEQYNASALATLHTFSKNSLFASYGSSWALHAVGLSFMLFVGILFILDLTKGVFHQKEEKFYLVFLFFVFTTLFVYMMIFPKSLSPHHFTSIAFFPVLAVTLVWRSQRRIVQAAILVGAFIFSGLNFYTTATSPLRGWGNFSECIAVATRIQTLSGGAFSFLYYRDNGSDRIDAQTWETTKYLYCLRVIGVRQTIYPLGGSFSAHQYAGQQTVAAGGALSKITFLICDNQRVTSCKNFFEKHYPNQWIVYEDNNPETKEQIIQYERM